MIYLIGGIIGALGGLGAFIYNLLRKNQALKDLLTQANVKDELAKIQEVLGVKEANIAIEERDYEQAKKDFESRVDDNTSRDDRKN